MKLLLIIVLLISCQTSTQSDRKKQTLDEILDQRLSQYFRSDGPGCAVLVAREGEVIYKKAFGMADVEHQVTLIPDNVFRIASITKQFTAIAILQLVQKGLLTLEDPIEKFIPDYPTHGYKITLKDLLSHTSGIKNITEISGVDGTISRTPLEVISIFKDHPMDFVPGTAFRYSNSGYVILGWVIERATGLSYEEYINKNIFEPLDMNASYYEKSSLEIENKVTGYRQNSDTTYSPAPTINMSNVYAAGALSMTVGDLLKFHKGLYEFKIVNKEMLEQATSPVVLPNGTKTPYGFGWGLQTLDGVRTIQHSGAIPGFTSFEIYLPAEDVFVAIFSNKENANLVDHSMLAASFAADLPSTNEVYPADDVINGYVGTYVTEDPFTFNIYRKGESLFWDNGDAPARQLHFTSDSTFYCYEVFPYKHTFTKDGYEVQAGDLFIKTTRVKSMPNKP